MGGQWCVNWFNELSSRTWRLVTSPSVSFSFFPYVMC